MMDQKLGILMLDTQFPRILGDAGNPDTYTTDVVIQIVENVGSLDVVNDQQMPPKILQQFIDAAQSLEQEGASAITSTCGFLFKEQDSISAAVDIPVMVSPLSLYSDIKSSIGRKKVVILTASETDLITLLHSSDDIEIDKVEIIGMEKCAAFSEAILRDKQEQLKDLRSDEIEEFIKSNLIELLSDRNDIGAILIECGNLPPYITAIKSVTDLPVYSILDGVEQIMS
jgi:aspartate/glutamate racemase